MKLLSELSYEELLERAGPLLRLPRLRHGDHDQSDHGNRDGGGNEPPDKFGNVREDGNWFDADGIYMSDSYVEKYGLPVTHSGFGNGHDGGDGRYSVVLSERGDMHVMWERDDGGPTGDALYSREASDVRIEAMGPDGARDLSADIRATSEATPGMSQTNEPTGVTLTSAPDGAVIVSGLGEDREEVELGEGVAAEFAEALDQIADTADDYDVGSRSLRAATFGQVVLSPYGSVREAAARYLHGLPALPPLLRHGDHDQSDHGNRDGGDEDDEDDDGPSGGDFGLGVDPKGVSYTEEDVDDDGRPKFSQAYRDKYGPVDRSFSVASEDGESNQYAVVIAERGFHVADDSNGTKEREVLQEFDNPREAYFLSQSISQVIDEDTQYPEGFPPEEGGFGIQPTGSDSVLITWTDGGSTTFTTDQAFELQEGLALAAGNLNPAFRAATFGRVVLSPHASVRAAAEEFLRGLPRLPPWHARHGDHDQSDHGNRDGGGSDSGGGRPGSGTDLSRDHDTMASIYNASVDENGSWIQSNKGDLALIGIAREQGFDGTPTVLSSDEFDRAVQEGGHAVMWRGVNPDSFWGEGKWDKVSGADVHAQVREGDYRPGYGVFGNGYYFATDREKAESFSDGEPGSLGRYALDADSRTVDYGDLYSEYNDYFESPDYRSDPTATVDMTTDFGRFAASKGYDAIRVPVGTRMFGGSTVQREEWVVLNRGALIADSGES